MQRILELIVAGAIGAAAPTVAALYFAKAPEIYMDAPQITMCGSSDDPCHITLSDSVRISVDDAMRVSLEDAVTVSIPDEVQMNVRCGGTLTLPCEVKLDNNITDPLTIRLQQ